MRQPRSIGWLSRLLIGAMLCLTALTGCVEISDVEIVGGTSRDDKLMNELTILGVTLPSDASQLSWLTITTWDSNDTYVRLTASRSSVVRLLSENKIWQSSMLPVTATDSYKDVLPEKLLSEFPASVARPSNLEVWSLSDAERSSAVAYPMGKLTPAVGAIILDQTATRPTVILHWSR